MGEKLFVTVITYIIAITARDLFVLHILSRKPVKATSEKYTWLRNSLL